LKSLQSQVEAFHRLIGAAIDDAGKQSQPLRLRLLHEEFRELIRAIESGDRAQIAGELVDLIYVAVGTAVSYGIELAPFWEAIHAANMRKIGVPGGKARKPEDWRAPDLYAILRRTTK
jgi:predicted HAD superfamily Cof-like phosphohydrolase